MKARNLSSGQRLLLIFIATLFVPALLLALFGARSLWQEKQFVAQQLQGRVDNAGEIAARVLADEMDRMQALVSSQLPPETAFQSFPSDGSWAFIELREDGLQTYPREALPYSLVPAPLVWSDPIFGEVEKLESEEADTSSIEAAYRALLSHAKVSFMPEIKHRLARTLRTAGSATEARRLWGVVLSSGGMIGALPANFVAASELASMDKSSLTRFCGDLTDGRWHIEKARYMYYMVEMCHAEDPRLPLAEALEAAAAGSAVYVGADGIHLAFRREKPFAALVVNTRFLAAHVWPRLSAALGTDVTLARITVNGKELLSNPVAPSGESLSAPQSLDAAGLSWRLVVAPLDAASFQQTMARTTYVYLSILAGVVVLTSLGGYFMVRTIRSELEVARMKSDFVSTVSHEFRSPLTGIRQLGEMLARGRVLDPDKQQQYYDLIVHESGRLTRLVENVLDFSRMEEGRRRFSHETFDTSVWLHSVAEDFQPEALRTGHKLEVSIPDSLPVVRGDREALSTALRNLLDNACKYSPQADTVWLDAEAAEGGVRVQVRDRGVGIPERDQSQIFEKFYRGGGELEKQVKGVGLGLSLVRHIMAGHNGEVHVESREGEGSIFSIHLSGAT